VVVGAYIPTIAASHGLASGLRPSSVLTVLARNDAIQAGI
jgi:hypothetical protein